MANCNDCICSEVCYYKSFNDVRNLKKRRNDVEKICKSFVHRDSLKNAPTVDAVEVVRCRDCKYFVQGEPYDPCECMKWIAKFAVAYTEPHGYCHKAERRTNG